MLPRSIIHGGGLLRQGRTSSLYVSLGLRAHHLQNPIRHYSSGNSRHDQHQSNHKENADHSFSSSFNYRLATASALATLTVLSLNNVLSTPANNDATSSVATIRIPKEAEALLIGLLGHRIDFTLADREAHGKDFSYHPPELPDAVVFPISEDEVVTIVKICSTYNIPIIPYGSGTSLEGHVQANQGGLCLDFRSMKQVVNVQLDEFLVTVQPGITYDELNEALAPHGYFFAMDPGPGASIGGMVSTSCSGTHAVRYGTMKENVIALRVVLPDGNVVSTRTKAKKSSAGYDLTHLFVGAEGTLGVVTEATLRIHPLPEKTAVSLVTFEKIEEASKTVIQTMQSGIQIGRAELMDDVMMKAVNMSNDSKYDQLPTLIFEFTGSPAQVDEQIAKVELLARMNKCKRFEFATDLKDRERLWFARKVALWSAPILKPGSEVIITDVCVPISKLSEIIYETKRDIESTSILAPLVSHAGDGNFHLFILFDPQDEKETKEAKQICDNLVHRALGMGGTCTGEHGVALGKKKYLEKELGKNAVDLMRTLKRTIDPKNLMNPGKVIDLD